VTIGFDGLDDTDGETTGFRIPDDTVVEIRFSDGDDSGGGRTGFGELDDTSRGRRGTWVSDDAGEGRMGFGKLDKMV